MARPKSYEELIVWQKAMALAKRTYKVSEGLPKNEAYGLLAQIRRAAVSVPSNIAEGYGRLTDTQFRHFLGNARGSLYEMQTQVRLAADLAYLKDDLARALLADSFEVGRLINALVSSLSQRRETNSANSASSANSANSASTANSAAL